MVKRKHTRRKQINNRNKSLNIIEINCNGLSGKRESLTANIEILKPLVFFIQETKFMKKGLFKHTNFEIFECIRNSGGGPILTGIDASLNPLLIYDGADDGIERPMPNFEPFLVKIAPFMSKIGFRLG